MKRVTQVLVAGGLLVPATPLWAESTQAQPTLDTVVVTGTLSETLIEDSPVPVQVISRETIESSQAATLEDLLADVPGIQLMQTHGQTGQSIQLNGMGEKHVLVLVDGVPLNQANRSNIDTRKVRLANVERIEIVSANASALYGSAAMGGVVHLITREAEAPGYEVGMRLVQAEASTDRAPTRTDLDGRLVTPLAGGQLASTLSLSYDAGFDRTPESWGDQTYNGLSWSVDERWDKGGDIDHSVGLSWSGWNLSQPSYPEPFEATDQEQRFGAQYQARADAGELILAGSVADGETHKTVQRDHQLWDASVDGRLFFDWFGQRQVVGSRVSTAYLTQSKTESGGTVEEIEPADQQSVEAYAQNDWFVGERLEFVAGLRSHWSDAYGVNWAPNLAGRFDISEGNFLRGSVGLGYRVPDIKERFYVFDHSSIGYRVFGNEDLNPETSLGAQLEWVAGPFSVEYFQRVVKDLISTTDIGSSGSVVDYEYTNIEEADIAGINLGLDGEWNSQKLSAAAQWLYAVNSGTDERLAKRPEYHLGLNHQWSFVTAWPQRFITRIEHTGPQYFSEGEDNAVDPYTLVDMSLATDVTTALTVTLGVNNLTDVWSESNGATDPLPVTGREYLLSLRYRNN